MKLSTSLLQAITLGISVTAIAATTTSCNKEKIKQKREAQKERNEGSDPANCPACGMG